MATHDDDAMLSAFGPVIDQYTRTRAIEDGELVDVSVPAREAGFRVPVALTRAVWADCVAWSEADNDERRYQDEAGRLWDVLTAAARAARCARNQGSFQYSMLRMPRRPGCRGTEFVRLKVIIGPGDRGEPVITILEPSED